MIKIVSWKDGILGSVITPGIGLLGLAIAVILDVTIASRTEWLWIVFVGFAVSVIGAGLMRNKSV